MVNRLVDIKTLVTTVTSALAIALILWLTSLDSRVRSNTSQNAVDVTYNAKIDSLNNVLIRIDENVKNMKATVGEIKTDIKDNGTRSSDWERSVESTIDKRIDNIEKRIER